MRNKALFLGVVGLVMVISALGLWQHTTIRATGPADLLPMQPFNPQAIGGIDTMQLGARNVDNYTVTEIIRGERFAIPWIYSGPGFDLDPYKKDSDLVAGSIISTTDANCQSTVATSGIGVAAKKIADGGHVPNLAGNDWGTPYDWDKSTTYVQGTSDSWLLSQVPPFAWIFRHTASMNNLWLGGSTEYGLDPALLLNTVYTNVPFSPNNSAFTATTKLGGNPNLPNTSSAVCTDSPQSSISVTTPYSNPPLLGNAGKPCLPGEICADAVTNGLWTDNKISVGGTPVTKAVTAKVFNSGPAVGNFHYHWDIELTNSAIMDAVWSPENLKQVDDPVAAFAARSTLSLTNDLKVTCTGAGEGLVVLKGVLWPDEGTREPYPDDNASLFVLKVVCNSGTLATQVDKAVIWVKPDLNVAPGGVSDPSGLTLEASHVQAIIGGAPVLVFLDELKVNKSDTTVAGKEWLEAETAVPGPTVSFSPGVSADQGDYEHAVPVPGVVNCNGSDPTCITYTIDEPAGQTDIHAQAAIACLGVPQGEYSVVIKAIDAPTGSIGEANPSDNAARMVIDVFCWTSESSRNAAIDTIDDGAGLYAKWTVFLSDPDRRKPFSSPPSLSSDTTGVAGAGNSPPNGGYIERVVRLECYWMDGNGCHPDAGGLQSCDTNHTFGQNYVDASESHADYNLVQLGGYDAVDSDHDCVMDYKYAQPGHPMEDEAAQPGGTCAAPAWVKYADKPNDTPNSVNSDLDCDGLVDGVERGYGSSPAIADTDNDGAKDFVELFQFSSPMNTDTDGDGFLDKPVTTYQNTNATVDNCPSVANNPQTNSDGAERVNGPSINGTYASQPNGDKMGDACDADDDNDALPDTGEALCTPGPVFSCAPATCFCDTTPGIGTRPDSTHCQLFKCDPVVADTDGDRCVDGVELLTGRNPLDPASSCGSLSATQLRFFRACRWNLPADGADGGYWNSTKISTNTDETELDADGDGVNCVTPTGNIGDDDNDNGTFTLAAAPLEINDNIEIRGYYTNASLRDTDGDGCDDWLEIMDINGDRVNSVGDLSALAKRGSPSPPAGFGPDPISDQIYDVNKDNLISVGDLSLMARNSCVIKPFGGGCNPQPCGSEN